jgi:hypothetical protein
VFASQQPLDVRHHLLLSFAMDAGVGAVSHGKSGTSHIYIR